MADFLTAYKETEKFEGGYSNDPDDNGGETYRGISRKNWPGWKGWEVVDALKAKSGFPKSLTLNQTLQSMVIDFYRRNFWSSWLDQTKSQLIANWVYDRSVNCGIGSAVKMLQYALNIKADGAFGPQTLNAVNSADETDLRSKLKEKATAYYEVIVERNPTQAKFLNGWLARC